MIGKHYVYPKLKGIRNEKGYTMQDMADKLKLSKNTYYKKENGKSDFSLSEIITLLNLLDTTFEDIFLSTLSTKK